MGLKNKFVAPAAHCLAERGTHLWIGRIKVNSAGAGLVHRVKSLVDISDAFSQEPFYNPGQLLQSLYRSGPENAVSTPRSLARIFTVLMFYCSKMRAFWPWRSNYCQNKAIYWNNYPEKAMWLRNHIAFYRL